MIPRILIAACLSTLALGAPAWAATGAPDPTFNGIGLVRLDNGGINTESDVALQPDGKLLVSGGGTNSDVARLHRLNADGSLDDTFGDHGLVTVDGPGIDVIDSVLVQPDGKVLAAGAAGRTAVIYRFTRTGAPDQGFGAGGKQTLTTSDGTEAVFDLALRGDEIVAVGKTVAATTKAAVWRRSAIDGSPDGSRAIALDDVAVATAVAIQPGGEVLVAGTTSLHGNGFVARLDAANLRIDPAFQGGVVALDAGAVETAQAMVLQPDGKIVVAGTSTVLTRIMVTRLKPGGELDPTFGGGGTRFLDSGGVDFVSSALVQPDGKLVLVGSTSLDGDVAFYRLDGAGTPDPSFGGDGLQTFDAGGADTASAGALQPDGDIVAVGQSTARGIVARVLGDPDPLAVVKAGSGAGAVVSDPAGLDCGPRCTSAFDVGSTVTLTAVPAAGSRFTGWSGCAATGRTCTLELHAPATVTATFAASPVSAATPPGTVAPDRPVAGADTTAPTIRGAKLGRRRFSVASRGTSVRYTLSETAATTIAIERGGRTVMTLRRARTIAGDNAVAFTARTLRPGRYRMVLTAVDAAGNRSAPVALRFTTVSRR